MDDRFVVFSGGKLEYRKGQDLVIAAFRLFREHHPEALLMTAWHNHWPQLITDLSLAGHVQGVPDVRDGALAIIPWLESNGIPADAVLDVGRVPNALMGRIVREAHVALFPNRAEGGTNLVAMECMAAGVPTIVSSNTGHQDLVASGGCIPLRCQQQVPHPTRFFRGTEGWGESDVAEIVDLLERAWNDRAAMRAVGTQGAEVMQSWSWRSQTDRLVTELRPLLHRDAALSPLS
jgi:glycosyltransferase involved in cell wall biosynthesis